jgi:hypothetical protein
MHTNVILTEEQWRELRDVVFGPCTVVGETMDVVELSKDFYNYVTENSQYADWEGEEGFDYWMLMRLDVEEWDIFPESPIERSDEEITRLKQRVKEQCEGIKIRMLEFKRKYNIEDSMQWDSVKWDAPLDIKEFRQKHNI